VRMDTAPRNPQAAALVRRLGLKPHPEGGWYKETHRSPTLVQTVEHGRRAAFTSILYLLEHPAVSRLHRLDAEELWSWHDGAALDVHVFSQGKRRQTHRLGGAPSEAFQIVVPAGCWFGAEVVSPGAFCLVGCVVAPGFEFRTFEIADRARLLTEYPQEIEIVERLT
jgi:predicted cupin superfamily sugar epimerase